MAEEETMAPAHSMRFLEMAFRTDRVGRIHKPDGYGRKTGECGDTVELFVSLTDEIIQAVRFEIDGCVHTHACANAVAEMMEGQSIDAAWNLTPDDVAVFLESLPANHLHCAELATGAFYLALADCHETRRSPWKKIYR